METRISVRSSDPNIASEITQIKIEGVTIRQRLVIREVFNPPVDFIIEVAKDIAIAVAAQLIARKLWEKLKDKKGTELTINNQPTEINVQNIEQLVLISLKEKEKE